MFRLGKKRKKGPQTSKSVRGKRKLTPAQRAQRTYASAMRSVRSRAARARNLCAQLGLGAKRA